MQTQIRQWMLVYTIVFGLLSIAFVYDDIQNRYSIIYIIEGVVVFLLIFAGNLIYSLHFISSKVRQIWKFVFPIIVLDFIVSAGVDLIYGNHAQGKDFDLKSIALVITFVLYLPTFWAHYKIGYGRESSVV